MRERKPGLSVLQYPGMSVSINILPLSWGSQVYRQ